MDSSRFKSLLLLMFCACLLSVTVFQVSHVGGAPAGGDGGPGGGGSGGVPPPRGGLGIPTGSFKLNRGLSGQSGVTCAYYNNFLLDASSGQQFKARLWTSGATINYTIISQSEFTSLQQNGCSYLSQLSSQIQPFSSEQITLNWSAPQTGWYVLFFYSVTPYSGPIYCIPES